MNTNDENPNGNAFTLSDLWKPSIFTVASEGPPVNALDDLGSKTFSGPHRMLICIQGYNENQLNNFNEKVTLHLQLPDLETFHYGPLEAIPLSDSVTTSIYGGDEGIIEDVKLDFWVDVGNDDVLSKDIALKTWERFYDRTFKEPFVYLSEAGPFVFDAALLKSSQFLQIQDNGRQNRPLLQDPLLRCFIQLGIGRQSSMFGYRTQERSFYFRHIDLRVSGYTLQSIQSLTTSFIKYGNQVVTLRSFVEDAYTQSVPSATYVAVAAAISSILSTLSDHFNEGSKSVQSFLQLQSIFELPRQLVDFLSKLIAKMSEAKSDAAMLSSVYSSTQEVEHIDARLRPVALQVLSFACQPWLESAERCMGLRTKNPADFNALVLDEPEYTDDILLDGHNAESSIPIFVGEQDRRTIMQNWQSLTLLKENSPDHLLLHVSRAEALKAPRLEWHFDWTDIERIEAKAKEYEANIIMAMGSKQSPRSQSATSAMPVDVYDYNPFSFSKEDLQLLVPGSHSPIDQPSYDIQPIGGSGCLHQCLKKALLENQRGNNDLDNNGSFAPPLSIASQLSFSPIISVQARLLNLACLQLVFKEHNLQSHLRLQRSFQLFGDGVFRSRLSHVLFDPELGSAERRKGHTRAGKMGLKLGARDSWPPASSELRLALMGILSESYNSIHHGFISLGLKNGDLPGGLSFAIRDISDEEIQKCLNPNSLEALDFLRLQYKAPAPLDSIITAQGLDKYDMMFKLLLRMTRMLFVVNQMSRSVRSRVRSSQSSISIDQRFRFEAQHFVSTVCEYCFGVAVSSTWTRFENDFRYIEQQLQSDDTAYEISSLIGINGLRQRHEQVLDDMLFALLLRKRQAQAMKHLEDIFGSILLYAKANDNSLGEETVSRSSSEIMGIYQNFKDKVGDFLAVCVSLSGKSNPGAAKQPLFSPKSSQLNRHDTMLNDGNGITQLLLKLQMNGYYSMPLTGGNLGSS